MCQTILLWTIIKPSWKPLLNIWILREDRETFIRGGATWWWEEGHQRHWVVFDFHPIHTLPRLCAQRPLKCEPHRGVFFEMDPVAAGNKLNVLASDPSRALVSHYHELWRPGAEPQWEAALLARPQLSSHSKQCPNLNIAWLDWCWTTVCSLYLQFIM